mgnify:CR=1 FL=1|jgi:hypothetical protein
MKRQCNDFYGIYWGLAFDLRTMPLKISSVDHNFLFL